MIFIISVFLTVILLYVGTICAMYLLDIFDRFIDIFYFKYRKYLMNKLRRDYDEKNNFIL